ncbi:MAG: putative SOS response-associated peptidase YedK [Firmicutes bacterium ADurb.Bin182]|nr:MAG: putative SOS response-associated peptidase YedK [Firmicutes bacterium ADurb.Bin182]
MCGRYYIENEEETIAMREILDEVNQRYYNTDKSARMKTGEIFPTDIVPVLTAGGGCRKTELMKWGFPRPNSSGVIINARAETANEKPMFRGLVKNKRCLIPASGFFEWKQSAPKEKTKYLLKPESGRILFFAGIFNTYSDADFPAFAILTTSANRFVSQIHSRMPYILTGDKADVWLFDEALSILMLSSECDARLTVKAV